jgi:glycosyltransferase involved in cell wall biosynthesis
VKRKNHIVFINPGQFGYMAGYYYYCYYLIKDLDYQVKFICFDQGFPKIELPGAQIEYVKSNKNRLFRQFDWLKAVYKTYKNNKARNTVFFMVYFKMCFIFPILFPFKKTILDIRTGSVIASPLKNWIQNQQFKLESLFFKKITILSSSLIKRLKINPSKCYLLPLGADIHSKNIKKYDSLKLIYIGTLGSIFSRKVHDTVKGLKIYIDNYAPKNTQITYDIFGFGSAKNLSLLKKTIEENDLTEIVKFHGRKNHQELKYFFNHCNIGVSYLPMTDYFDCQPLTKTFEYILSGMVCLAVNTYENRLLINKENGVLCEDTPDSFAKALKEITENIETYDSNVIRESLKNYTWEKIVENSLKPILS